MTQPVAINTTYRGGFVNGKKHGRGIITFSDGSSYEGEWKEDQKHGEGRASVENNLLYGMWEEDSFVGASMAAQSSAQGSG